MLVRFLRCVLAAAAFMFGFDDAFSADLFAAADYSASVERVALDRPIRYRSLLQQPPQRPPPRHNHKLGCSLKC
jgi:hypothetical protein